MKILRLAGLLAILYLVLDSLPETVTKASSIKVDGESGRYELHSQMELLEDKDHQWDIEKVSQPPLNAQFIESGKGVPSYGYTSAVYWVRFEVHNTTSEENWLLEVPYPPHDAITLYTEENGSFTSNETGDLLPFVERDVEHRNFVYQLSLEEDSSQTFYVRFESEGSMQLPLTLWSEEQFLQKSQHEYLLLGLYYGIGFVMILYNLFLFFSLRLRSYLWYVLFIFSLLFVHFTLNGLAFQYVWPELPWWNHRAIVFFMAVANGTALLFSRSFLNLRLHIPKLDSMFKWFVLFQFFIAVILMVNYQLALNLVMGSTIVLVFAVIGAAFICWKRGYRPARFFLFGWVIFLIGVFVSSLADAGLIPVLFLTKYASQIGSVLEVILFSLALADKFKILQLEKEHAEREAKESQKMAVEHLQWANKMKDDFLASTTHELRTPLNGIIGIAESLKDGAAGEADERLKQNLGLIISSGMRLSHLVNDLLDYSKLKHKDILLKIKPVRVREMVDVIFSLLSSLKRESVQFENNVPVNLPPAKADEDRIQQIFYNLIGNALKFTEKGSISVSAFLKDDKVTIEIADTGKGITPTTMEVLFDDFEQGEGAHKKMGTGIGLSITKHLVELHGGSIRVDSRIGKGSTFSFDMPLYADGTVQKHDEAQPGVNAIEFPVFGTKRMKSEKGTILVADDERVNLQVIVNQLVLNGYEVLMAQNGQQVLEMVKEPGRIDLIILDVMMPKKTGYEVSREIRKSFSLTELPILILTARSDIKDIVTAFESGANDYLMKPCSKEELLARVETLMTLEKVMEQVHEKAEQLSVLNEELSRLNNNLEARVKDRTELLEKKTNELARVEASRRKLLSNISHELGTPMTSLQGYVKAMIDGIVEVNDPHYLNLIYQKVCFLDRIIQDLYDLSRLEARQVSFQWREMTVENVIDYFYDRFELDITSRGVRYEYNVKDVIKKERGATARVVVDLDRLEQVMSNLVFNAIKHTSKGGHVEVRFETQEVKQMPSQESSFSDSALVMSVHDNGQGIREDELPQIFDRFFRGDESRTSKGGNTGLGLAISKEIVEYHKGRIWAKSKTDAGSSFYVALPLQPVKGVVDVG